MSDTQNTQSTDATEQEIADTAVTLYQSLVTLTERGDLSDTTVAQILEKRAEELR